MIEIRHISKSYGSVKVLDDVSLSINKGETISVIGHSGSGKSTLLNCIAGLTVQDHGEITLDGETMSEGSRSSIGMVFQEHNLFPHLTILNNMTLAPVHVLGMSRKEAEEKAFRYLGIVGMWERRNDYPDSLSLGQRQRVAIARSLMMDPEYLLLDEPTSSLDPISEAEVADVIRGLKKQDITIILVTHRIDLAREVSDRIIFMHEGRICEQGNPEEIIDNPQNRYTKAFMNYSMSLVYEIKSPQYDHPELNARIEFFCRKYRLGKGEVHSVQLVVEELLNILPLEDGLVLSISKSAVTKALTVDAALEDKGKDHMSAQEVVDDLSYIIISGMCDTMTEYIDEENLRHIHLEIRNNTD